MATHQINKRDHKILFHILIGKASDLLVTVTKRIQNTVNSKNHLSLIMIINKHNMKTNTDLQHQAA